MSQLERKSIEPIALNVECVAKVRVMQHFLSDIDWDEEQMLSRYQDMFVDKAATGGSAT